MGNKLIFVVVTAIATLLGCGGPDTREPRGALALAAQAIEAGQAPMLLRVIDERSRHALAVGHGPVLQASFGGQVFRGMRYIPAAQRCQQVARQDHPLPPPLGQPLFG